MTGITDKTMADNRSRTPSLVASNSVVADKFDSESALESYVNFGLNGILEGWWGCISIYHIFNIDV